MGGSGDIPAEGLTNVVMSPWPSLKKVLAHLRCIRSMVQPLSPSITPCFLNTKQGEAEEVYSALERQQEAQEVQAQDSSPVRRPIPAGAAGAGARAGDGGGVRSLFKQFSHVNVGCASEAAKQQKETLWNSLKRSDEDAGSVAGGPLSIA